MVGTGRAAKEQVQAMVQRLLRLNGMPAPDSADALACAICHAHSAPLLLRLSDKDAAPGRGVRIRAGRLVA